jgi:hypothetical protein
MTRSANVMGFINPEGLIEFTHVLLHLHQSVCPFPYAKYDGAQTENYINPFFFQVKANT